MTMEQLHGFYDTTLKNRDGQPVPSLKSAVGQRIKLRELEEELGTLLVDPRSAEGTTLTLAGKMVFLYGKYLFAGAEACEKVRELR